MHKHAMRCAAFFVFICVDTLANGASAPLIAQSAAQLTSDAAKIRQEMQPKGKYEYIEPQDRDKVEARLSEMQQTLAGHANAAELSPPESAKLATARDEVNTILQHSDSERLICEMATTTGTTVPKKICHTFGSERRHQQNGR
jgi:hypothetical protein